MIFFFIFFFSFLSHVTKIMTSFLYIYEWMRCMYDGVASWIFIF